MKAKLHRDGLSDSNGYVFSMYIGRQKLEIKAKNYFKIPLDSGRHTGGAISFLLHPSLLSRHQAESLENLQTKMSFPWLYIQLWFRSLFCQSNFNSHICMKPFKNYRTLDRIAKVLFYVLSQFAKNVFWIHPFITKKSNLIHGRFRNLPKTFFSFDIKASDIYIYMWIET
jgi:hypothetical protein